MAVQPVVKWIGGKRQLLPEIMETMPGAFDKDTATFLSLSWAAGLFCLAFPHVKLWLMIATKSL